MTSPQELPSLTEAQRRALFIDSVTPAQIESALTEALARHDVEAVPGLLRLLAVKAPHRAQLVLDAIELASTIRERETTG